MTFLAEKLELRKRVSSVAITDMQPSKIEIDGKLVKLCLNCGKANLTFLGEAYEVHICRKLRR